jgi:hypothetical protein
MEKKKFSEPILDTPARQVTASPRLFSSFPAERFDFVTP